MSVPAIIVLLAFFALLIGSSQWELYRERKRDELFRRLSQTNGLQYREVTEADLLQFQALGFELFQRGRRKRCRRILQGSRQGNISLSLLEYSYVTGHGKNSKTHRQTCVILASPQARIPQFRLQPRRLSAFFPVLSLFGRKSISFDSDLTFAKVYHLSGENETAIQQTFASDLRSELLSLKNTFFEGRNNSLLGYRRGRWMPENELPEFLQQTESIFRKLAR
jgi:hypothetical protein